MRLTTPFAILLGLCAGGAFIAIATFLALRANGAEMSAKVANLPVPGVQGAGTSGSAPAPASPVVSANGEAMRALDEQRATLVSRCFTPLATKPPEVRSVSFHLAVGFDADGRQATKIDLVPRSLKRPDITECIGRELQPIRIPKGVGPATVDLVLSIP